MGRAVHNFVDKVAPRSWRTKYPLSRNRTTAALDDDRNEKAIASIIGSAQRLVRTDNGAVYDSNVWNCPAWTPGRLSKYHCTRPISCR
jgi:hypothetical protein